VLAKGKSTLIIKGFDAFTSITKLITVSFVTHVLFCAATLSRLIMSDLLFYSLVENTCMTSSLTKKELCTHKANCMLYICMLAVSRLPVSKIILFDFGIVSTMYYFLFFISLYISCHFFLFFLRLVDDDMFTFLGFISRSLFVLIQAFVLIVLVVFMLYLYYLLFLFLHC
jgi:hypothetical protein